MGDAAATLPNEGRSIVRDARASLQIEILMAKILIIDDDEPFRSSLEQLLTAAGHTVVTADDGMAGAQLYRANPTDLILTDMVMPHSGLGTIRVLRSQFPDLRVIAMSGGGAHRLGYARDLGARCTLAKPFTLEQLAAAIAETLAAPPVPPEATA